MSFPSYWHAKPLFMEEGFIQISKHSTLANSSRVSKFRVREQFPKEIEERRKMLYPAMYRLKANPNNRVSLVRDKLYVNGHLYIPENDPDYRLSRPRNECHPPKETTDMLHSLLNDPHHHRKVHEGRSPSLTRTPETNINLLHYIKPLSQPQSNYSCGLIGKGSTNLI